MVARSGSAPSHDGRRTKDAAWVQATGTGRARVPLLLRRLSAGSEDICILPARTGMGVLPGSATETASRVMVSVKRPGVSQAVSSDRVRCNVERPRGSAED